MEIIGLLGNAGCGKNYIAEKILPKILTHKTTEFGGISGLTISENGENFVFISDRSFSSENTSSFLKEPSKCYHPFLKFSLRFLPFQCFCSPHKNLLK